MNPDNSQESKIIHTNPIEPPSFNNKLKRKTNQEQEEFPDKNLYEQLQGK